VTEDPEKLFEEYRQELNQIKKEGIHPVIYKDTIKNLRALKNAGKTLIVLSSHPEQNLKQEAKEYNVEKFFKLLFGNAKDKTEAILKVCNELKIFPSVKDVAYVGDTIYDIKLQKKQEFFQ